MTISEELLAILVCPKTHQRLRLASAEELAAINHAIERHQIRSVSGETVQNNIDGALVREDGQLCYPIRADIPILLYDEALTLSISTKS
ncbi:MAG: hypothetical protein QY326_07100 [Bdellovibrionota bacterium]|nr:MAG: hypothetical protein QY326_07100 [Bdellovibrionota bacterium]